jgi:hypothetical protein
MISTMYVALELKTQLQDEDSLGPNPYRRDLFSLISEAKARMWTTIECGETNIKAYLLASMVTAQIEGLRQGVEKRNMPDWLLQAAEQAEERCVAFLEEKAGQSASSLDVSIMDEMGLNRTPAYMGDWEYIVSSPSFHQPRPVLMSGVDVGSLLQRGERGAHELGSERRKPTIYDVR